MDRCSVCGRRDKILLCSKCEHSMYCSIECQTSDWTNHKTTCSLFLTAEVKDFIAFVDAHIPDLSDFSNQVQRKSDLDLYYLGILYAKNESPRVSLVSTSNPDFRELAAAGRRTNEISAMFYFQLPDGKYNIYQIGGLAINGVSVNFASRLLSFIK
jgi:hypothetical protein